MKNMIRTFVAVEIDSAIRQRAEKLIEKLRAAPADVKWVAAHNLHLTVKFVGDVPSREIVRVCEAVELGAAEVEPFDVEVRGAGAFPNAHRPRTLWLGVGKGEAKMVALHDRVEDALSELGHRKEHRRFHSHLTLGRVRRGGPAVTQLGELVERHADFDVGKITVAEAVVFSSQLGPKGPTYEALSRVRLGG
jgi:2'-5' RNA ligase